MTGEELAERAAATVRELIAEAEREAAAIRAAAEADAAKIREGAEAEARERLEQARRALDEAGGRLAGESAVPTVASGTGDVPAAASSDAAPGPGPSDAAARLIAMKLALGGSSRSEIETRLAADYPGLESATLLDDVFSRVNRA